MMKIAPIYQVTVTESGRGINYPLNIMRKTVTDRPIKEISDRRMGTSKLKKTRCFYQATVTRRYPPSRKESSQKEALETFSHHSSDSSTRHSDFIEDFTGEAKLDGLSVHSGRPVRLPQQWTIGISVVAVSCAKCRLRTIREFISIISTNQVKKSDIVIKTRSLLLEKKGVLCFWPTP